MSARTYTELDYALFDSPVIIGNEAVKRFNKLFAYVYSTRNPCSLIGDPGVGKTYTGRKIAEEYARTRTKQRLRAIAGVRNNRELEALLPEQLEEYMGKIEKCRAFYVQCDSETMRQTFIGGVYFRDGSEVSELAVVAYAMKYGHVVFVDEFTHGDPSIQTMLNSVMDSEAIIAVGDILVKRHPDFRIFVGHNRTKHAGNFPIRPSTASRLVSWVFDDLTLLKPTNPSKELLEQIRTAYLEQAKIAYNISKISIGEQNIKPPMSVFKYLSSWASYIRRESDNQLPVTARNVAAMCDLFSISTFKENAPLPVSWTRGTSAGDMRQKVAEWVFFAPVGTSLDLHDKEVNEVMHYFAGLGRENVIEMVLQCSMYDEHVDGVIMKNYRSIMAGSIC